MEAKLLALLGIALVCGLAEGYGRPGYYDGYQVLKVVPSTEEQVKYLNGIQDKIPTVDFWTRSRKTGDEFEFMVPPRDAVPVRKYLRKGGLKFQTSLSDVEGALGKIREDGLRRRQMRAMSFDYNDFNTYDDIMTEADNMVASCPTSHGFKCEVYSIGQSFEGRDMKMFRIYKEEENRPIYWLDALNHAREWLSGAVQLKIIKHMLDDVATDDDVKRLLDKGDWYFLLVFNPDGYDYTWTDARLWRKNRFNRTTILNPGGDECAGIDLNRNFIHRWFNAGTSNDPCSNLYGGPSPGSEIETQNVVNEVYRIEERLKAFVTLHTAGRYILMPWGSCMDPGFETECEFLEPETHNKVLNVVNAMVTAIEDTHGVHQWTGGTSCDVLYPSSGTADDFVVGYTGMPYAFNPELRDTDNNGRRYIPSIFTPEASEIHPAYEETWNGIVAMVDTIDLQ